MKKFHVIYLLACVSVAACSSDPARHASTPGTDGASTMTSEAGGSPWTGAASGGSGGGGSTSTP